MSASVDADTGDFGGWPWNFRASIRDFRKVKDSWSWHGEIFLALSSESLLRFLIDSEDHFETGRTGGTGEECKKEAACACNGVPKLTIDLEDACDFGLLHSGSFEYFGDGDAVVD